MLGGSGEVMTKDAEQGGEIVYRLGWALYWVCLVIGAPAYAWEADGFKSGMSEPEVREEATVRSIILHEWFRTDKTSGLNTPLSGSQDTDYQFEFCDGKLWKMHVFRVSGRLEDFARIVELEIDRRGRPLFDARVQNGDVKLTAEWSNKEIGTYRVILDYWNRDESVHRQFRDVRVRQDCLPDFPQPSRP